jgi:hypothetical protein
MPPLTTTLPRRTPDGPAGGDRPASFTYRTGHGTQARAAVVHGGHRWAAEVCNVSGVGVSLRVPELVPVGSLVTVELSSADGRFARALGLRVLYAHAAAAGRPIIGGSFHAGRLTDEDLASLLTLARRIPAATP